MAKFAPSILSADFARLGLAVTSVEAAGADYIHFDVMDGHFVPNISFGAPVLRSLRRVTTLPLDVHLMISEPDRYIDSFIKAGADIVTVHFESEGDTARQVRRIREQGALPAVAIKPATPVEEIFPLLPELYMALVMTVEPGFGGQGFIPEMVPKIKTLRGVIDRYAYPCLIQIDGGVTRQNAPEIASYGVDIIVAGSAVFDSPDPAATLLEMRKKTEDI